MLRRQVDHTAVGQRGTAAKTLRKGTEVISGKPERKPLLLLFVHVAESGIGAYRATKRSKLHLSSVSFVPRSRSEQLYHECTR